MEVPGVDQLNGVSRSREHIAVDFWVDSLSWLGYQVEYLLPVHLSQKGVVDFVYYVYEFVFGIVSIEYTYYSDGTIHAWQSQDNLNWVQLI